MFQKSVSIIRCKRGKAPTDGMRLTLSDGPKAEILPLLHVTMERSNFQNVTSEKPQDDGQSLKLYCKVIQMTHH